MNIYVILCIQLMIAGGTHIVAKAVVGHIDAATLTFVRSLFSTTGMAAMLLVQRKGFAIERSDWKRIMLIGFLALPINQFFYLYGMKFSTAANGALLYASTPALVLVFSALLLGERVTRRKVIGISLAFVGIAIVIFERGVDFSTEYTFGNAMILVAVIAWAFFTILGRPLIVKYGALKTTALSTMAGALMFAPFGLASAARFPFTALTTLDWVGIIYLSVGTSILGYVLWYYALGRIDASKVAVFANGQPIFATILSLIFLDYTMTGMFVIGGLITIAGVVITQLS